MEFLYIKLVPGLFVFGGCLFLFQIRDIISSTSKKPVSELNYLLAALAAIAFVIGICLSTHHYWYDIIK